MRRLILRSHQSPGDILMLTAAVRDLHLAHPGQFQTDVRTSCPDLWERNPFVTPLSERDPGVQSIEMHYPLVHESNQRPYHFLHGYPQYLEQVLGVRIPLTQFRGDIHLADDERETPQTNGHPPLPERYWILVAGGKFDFTAKWWNPASYQKVVDHFRNRITFVQCGEAGHWHPPLEGVVNFIGKTTPREFVRLMHHAEGVVCPVTFAMHLAAATPTKPGRPPWRPCVVIAGGREPAHWEAYPQHQFLSTNGALPCCLNGGCWRSRCQPVGDGDAKDRSQLCERPVQISEELRIPQCLEMITAEDVIRRIELYFEGGVYPSPDAVPRTASRAPHSSPASAANPTAKTVGAASPRRAHSGRLILRCDEELESTIELSIVLRHLRHYQPQREIRCELPSGQRRLFEGSSALPSPPSPPAGGEFDEIRRIRLSACEMFLADAPSTSSARCLREDLRLSPLADLFRYEARVPASASAAARRFLAERCGQDRPAEERLPIVLLDFRSAAIGEELHVNRHQLVEFIRRQRLRPLILASQDESDFHCGERLAAEDSYWASEAGSLEELLAGLVQQAALVMGTPAAALRLASAVKTPAIALWTAGDPLQGFDLSPNVRHLLPETAISRRSAAAERFFRQRYRFQTYQHPTDALMQAALDALQSPTPPVAYAPAATVEPPRRRPSAGLSKTSPSPPAANPRSASVKFMHGLGDCANFARLIPLYVRRGIDVAVECTPDKTLLFEAAGARIVPKAEREHAWGYPPVQVHAGHGGDHVGSKAGWNISEAPLPFIGDKAELWPEYCDSRVRVSDRIPERDRDAVRRWLDLLPRPLVLLHSKGNTNQRIKSLPDTVAAYYYRELLDRFDGTLVLLDWDNRVPRLATFRVRHLSELSDDCSLGRMFALMEEADLMIGVDSGPLHAAGLTKVPRVGLWMPGHYPARYALPDPQQLNLVLGAHTSQWNRYRRVPWNIVEQPGSEWDARWLAEKSLAMLGPPRYLDSERMGTDVQLQHWIADLCGGNRSELRDPYTDRHRTFDALLREATRRFERPTFIETGCIRSEEDWAGAGFSTYLFAAYLQPRGGRLHSVDLNPAHCWFAQAWCQGFGDTVTIHRGDSLPFLKSFPGPIDVLYLDSLDTTEPGHAEHALREFQAAEDKLHENSLILIDDTPWVDGALSGKGARLVPWLLENGWRIRFAGYQVLLERSAS